MRQVKAYYTEEAKKGGIQGSVYLDAVVLTDGTVGEVRVTRSLDAKYGLDAQAVKALSGGSSSQVRRTGSRFRCASTSK